MADMVLQEMQQDEELSFKGDSHDSIQLPSNLQPNQVCKFLQPNQVCKLQFRKDDKPFIATVRGVHFYVGKVKYDLGLWMGDGSVDDPEYETRIYNVDSVFCSPA